MLCKADREKGVKRRVRVTLQASEKELEVLLRNSEHQEERSPPYFSKRPYPPPRLRSADEAALTVRDSVL